MDNNIQNYRQPMVTSIGIILGFVLGFTGKWATDDPNGKLNIGDYIVLIGLIISIILLIVALFRILNNAVNQNNGLYYKKTLTMFILGVCSAFVGIFISIIQSLFIH